MKIKKPSDPFSIDPDCLFFSDLHLHERKEFSRVDPETGLNSRLMEGLNILDQIIEILRKEKISFVYNLGDPIELKDRVPNHILVELQNRFVQIAESGVEFFNLKGNHDYNLPNYPTLSIFRMKDMLFNFIDKPGGYGSYSVDSNGKNVNPNIVYFIPFQRDFEDFKREWTNAHKTDPKPSVICFHQEIPGGVYESGKPITGVWNFKTDPEILYLSGHLHKPQKVHGIQFLGAPYEIKFSDQEQNRFVWLYNSKTKELRPLQLNYPRFITLDYNELNMVSGSALESIVDGNYIRIAGEVERESFGQKEKKYLKEKFEKAGAKAVVFKVTIKRKEQVKGVEKGLTDDQSVIREYAEKNVGVFNLKRLEKIGLETYESL